MKPGKDFLAALIETILPAETAGLSEEQRAQCLDYVRDFVRSELADLPWSMRALFMAGMLFFRFFVIITRFSGFSRLSAEKRRTTVEAWAWGRFYIARQLFRVVRSLALLAFYEIPAVKAGMGYPAARPESPQAAK